MKRLFLKLRKWATIALLGKEAYARSIGVKIGTGCRILIDDFGSEPFLIRIGDRVTITARVILLTHDGSTWLMRDAKGRRQRYGRIDIGSDVFIGIGSILMPGVSVGDRCVIGAGAVVTKSIPPGHVVAGNPARILCTYDDFVTKGLACLPAEGDVPAGIPFQDKVLLMLPRCPSPASMTPPSAS